MDRIAKIIDYWFEGITDEDKFDTQKMPFKKWFIKDEAMDAEIRERFEEDLHKAADGQYEEWKNSNEGILALIILFDQFSRNMYRDTSQMYATDALALELALKIIAQKKDLEFMQIYRAFLYLPLMHAEDLSVQELSVKCYQRLVDDSKSSHPNNTPYFQYNLDYALKHHDDIAQFGRFPYRDAVLKRSTV